MIALQQKMIKILLAVEWKSPIWVFSAPTTQTHKTSTINLRCITPLCSLLWVGFLQVLSPLLTKHYQNVNKLFLLHSFALWALIIIRVTIIMCTDVCVSCWACNYVHSPSWQRTSIAQHDNNNPRGASSPTKTIRLFIFFTRHLLELYSQVMLEHQSTYPSANLHQVRFRSRPFPYHDFEDKLNVPLT